MQIELSEDDGGDLPPKVLFGFFRTVAGARLFPPLHALGIENAPDDRVTNTRQIVGTAASDEDHRMLLQIVPFAWNVRDDLVTACQANFCNFS
jgi:hypothetical protein